MCSLFSPPQAIEARNASATDASRGAVLTNSAALAAMHDVAVRVKEGAMGSLLVTAVHLKEAEEAAEEAREQRLLQQQKLQQALVQQRLQQQASEEIRGGCMPPIALGGTTWNPAAAAAPARVGANEDRQTDVLTDTDEHPETTCLPASYSIVRGGSARRGPLSALQRSGTGLGKSRAALRGIKPKQLLAIMMGEEGALPPRDPLSPVPENSISFTPLPG